MAAMFGVAVYSQSKRGQFVIEFNKINLDREKSGLEPLDLCTEKYHFNPIWAKDDPACRERIKRYEAGDESALGSPQAAEPRKKGI